MAWWEVILGAPLALVFLVTVAILVITAGGSIYVVGKVADLVSPRSDQRAV
jgi:hypothetical protein